MFIWTVGTYVPNIPFTHLSLSIYIYTYIPHPLLTPSLFFPFSLPFHLSISVTTVAIHIQLVSGVLILSEPDGTVRRLRVPQLWPPDTGPCRSSALLTDLLDSCRQGALHRLITLFCRVFVVFYYVFLLLFFTSAFISPLHLT
jgi:hypothetical protein